MGYVNDERKRPMPRSIMGSTLQSRYTDDYEEAGPDLLLHWRARHQTPPYSVLKLEF